MTQEEMAQQIVEDEVKAKAQRAQDEAQMHEKMQQIH